MAIWTRYYHSWTSRQGDSWQVLIEKDAVADPGASTQIYANDVDHSGVYHTLETEDPFAIMAPSEGVIKFLDISSAVADELFSDLIGRNDYRIHFKRAGSTYWRGFMNMPDLQQEEDETNPPGSLTAHDGLTYLKSVPYSDAGTGALYTGVETVTEIFVDILDRIGFDLNIYIGL